VGPSGQLLPACTVSCAVLIHQLVLSLVYVDHVHREKGKEGGLMTRGAHVGRDKVPIPFPIPSAISVLLPFERSRTEEGRERREGGEGKGREFTGGEGSSGSPDDWWGGGRVEKVERRGARGAAAVRRRWPRLGEVERSKADGAGGCLAVLGAVMRADGARQSGRARAGGHGGAWWWIGARRCGGASGCGGVEHGERKRGARKRGRGGWCWAWLW
jgi:hypothetical protein